jgi:hypothetical protein
MHDFETYLTLLLTLGAIMLPVLFIAGVVIVTIVKAIKGDFYVVDTTQQAHAKII